MIPVILALAQLVFALSTLLKIIRQLQGGIVTDQAAAAPDPSQMKPEDAAALAIAGGLNALFGAWSALDKMTNGKIPDWDTLASRNALLQAQIDAEKI
jgi:hypothetical protein